MKKMLAVLFAGLLSTMAFADDEQQPDNTATEAAPTETAPVDQAPAPTESAPAADDATK